MSNPVAPPQWETTKTAGDSLGIATELLDVRVHDDIPRAFSAPPRRSSVRCWSASTR